MIEHSVSYVDKSKWDRGPWDVEPDVVGWIDHDTKLPCIAYRHPEFGNYCGYVGYGPEHPSFGNSYDDVGVPVHGGLTYSSPGKHFLGRGQEGHEDEPLEKVCANLGIDPSDFWWVGFDCGHLNDLQPGMIARMRELIPGYADRATRDIYRDLSYVKNECRDLAAGLLGMIPPLIQLAKCADKEAEKMKPFNWKAMKEKPRDD